MLFRSGGPDSDLYVVRVTAPGVYRFAVGPTRSDSPLDLALQVLSSGSSVLAGSAPMTRVLGPRRITGTSAALDRRLAVGTYLVRVRGDGQLHAKRYGSIGGYRLLVTRQGL